MTKYQEKMQRLAADLQRQIKKGEMGDQEAAYLTLRGTQRAAGKSQPVSRRTQRRKSGTSVKKAYGYE